MNSFNPSNDFNTSAPQKPVLCVSCNEFYGNQAFDGQCSKCYKMKKQSSPIRPQASQTKTEKSEVPHNIQSMYAVNTHEEQVKPEPMEVEQVKAEKNVQHDHSKCFKCMKKVGLLGFKCTCEFTFCKSHRMPEDHECNFDFAKIEREKLSKLNPVVKGSKIEKF